MNVEDDDQPPGDDVYVEDDAQAPEDDNYLEDDDEYWNDPDLWGGGDGYYALHLFTIPEEHLDSVVHHFTSSTGVVGAWLSACQELPGVRGLEDLKRLHPTFLPSWLALDKTSDVLAKLEVRAGNHVVFNKNLAADTHARTAEREAQLESFRSCRFQEGFASEGMLCNSPPLPLRVLDYLEAADLLSLSLVCKATHRASHYLFRREEEVLNRPDIVTPDLHPAINRAPTRHRAMRAASLLCGTPEALDVTTRCPSLLHNLVAAPDAGTQAHVSWESWLNENDEGLTEILEARRVQQMGEVFTVDPEGWPSRDREAIERLQRKVRRYLDGEGHEELTFHEGIALAQLNEEVIEKTVKDVAKLFEAAREQGQVVLMFQDFLD